MHLPREGITFPSLFLLQRRSMDGDVPAPYPFLMDVHSYRTIPIMLEDDFTYVLRKAFRGLSLSPSEAAKRAGLPEKDVLALSRGQFSADTARKLAPALGLDADAFAAHDTYEPALVTLDAITRLRLPFGDDHVNAWLVSQGHTNLLFDTGDDIHSCAEHLMDLEMHPTVTFITHSHPDHVAGLPSLRGKKYGCEIAGTDPISAGDALAIGELTVRAIDLSGHDTPAVGYLIEGLEKPILVVGDAVFAGSIGGCDPSVYHDAIRRIKAALGPLSDETIILPGHGPATTVGEERVSNPFLVG